MARVANTAEGGSNGTTVTPANSGAGSGSAFDLVSIGTSCGLTFDNAHPRGGLAYKIVTTGATTGAVFLEWSALGTLTAVSLRLYLYMTALPSGGAVRLIRFLNGATEAGVVVLNASGQIQLRDSAGSIAGNMTAAIAINQWVRIEASIVCNASTGSIEAVLFNSPDSTTPTETITKTGRNTLAQLTKVDFGETNVPGSVGARTYWLDDLALDTAGYPGPSLVSLGVLFPPPVAVAGLTAAGATAFAGAAALRGVAIEAAAGSAKLSGAAALGGVGVLGAAGSSSATPALAAVQVYGAAGSFHGLDAVAVTPSGDSLAAVAVPGWAFHAGKTAGWAVWHDGKLFMAGQDQGLNSLRTVGTECLLSIFDPAVPALTHLVVPTSTGASAVVGANGLTGGAYGADVAVASVGGVNEIVMLMTAPYDWFNAWSIAASGVYPVLAVFRKTGGVWSYDAGRSIYTADLAANSAAGALAFPAKTNGAGETYYDASLFGEIEFDPASGHLIGVQYGRVGAFAGGSWISIDLASKTVIDCLPIPFVPQGVVTQIAPRSMIVGPAGKLACAFDTFNGAVDAGFNVAQHAAYDGAHFRLTSNWLRTSRDADHWASGCFDDAGGWWAARRAGTQASPLAYFPAVDGAIKPTQGPFAFTGLFGQTCAPDFTLPYPGSEVSWSTSRMSWDPTLGAAWLVGGNETLIAFRPRGNVLSPRIVYRGPIDLGVQAYIRGGGSPEPGVMWPMDAALDIPGRRVWRGIGQLDPRTWPAAPVARNGYLYSSSLDLAASPTYADAIAHGQLAGSLSASVPLPVGWRPGQIALVAICCTLTSNDAAITPPAGWALVDPGAEVSNGTSGIRYAWYWRILQAGDGDPTFTLPRSANLGEACAVFDDVDAASPFAGWASDMAASGAVVTAPSITPAVGGCRLVRFYAIQGAVAFSGLAAGDAPRASQLGELGGGVSILLTSSEAPATTSPTGATTATASVGAKHGGQTLALRPAGLPADPAPLSSLTIAPGSVQAGGVATGTVSLPAPAPRDTLAKISSSKPDRAAVPATVTIPAGSASASFPIVTTPDS